MKKYTNLIFGVIGVFIVINTFLKDMTVKEIFGFEINIWVYRAIWTLIAIASFYDFFFKKKEEAN